MKNKRKRKNTSTRNPIESLQEAIQNLENFSKENEKSHIPTVHNLDIEDGQLVVAKHSHIESTMNITRTFFQAIFKGGSKNIKKEQVQRKLLESIQFLKTHYRIIHKLKKGNSEEKLMAEWALNSIQRYNKLIYKSKETPRSLKQRVENFVFKQSGLAIDDELKLNTIDIPHEYSMVLFSESEQEIETKTSTKSTSEKVSSLLPKISISNKELQPTRPEIDVLRMKSLSLAKYNPKFPASLKKTLSTMVWNTPIEITPYSAESTGESLVHLEQTFEPLPGEVIKVTGSFKRDAKSHVPSVPIPDSFHLMTHAYQTGFPTPLQHTGIAFSEQLIPDNPLRLDMLPHFQKLFKAKQKFAEDLLPEGAYNEKAKNILQIKSSIFYELRHEILRLHQKLVQSIIYASELTDKHEDVCVKIISKYFTFLKSAENPLESLAEVHTLINELFIQYPFEKLYESKLGLTSDEFDHFEPKERYLTCLEELEDSIDISYNDVKSLNEQIGKDESWQVLYVLEVGKALGNIAKALFLQQFSEKMGFPPPLLNDVEQKLQMCTFMQMMSFHHELENMEEHKEKIIIRITKQLKEEIVLFEAESFDSIHNEASEIVKELELYYNSRFYGKII
jgi:hypothetical protein